VDGSAEEEIVLRQADLGRGGRFVATCLAGVWLTAGLVALGAGLGLRPGVFRVCLGVLALGYGWLWVRVAVTGERQRWPPSKRARR
jgi:hypothetical protein